MIEKGDIEKQLQSHEWLTKLVEDQLKLDKTTYHTFGENFESGELKNKFKNVTIRKVRYESDDDTSIWYKKQQNLKFV